MLVVEPEWHAPALEIWDEAAKGGAVNVPALGSLSQRELGCLEIRIGVSTDEA